MIRIGRPVLGLLVLIGATVLGADDGAPFVVRLAFRVDKGAGRNDVLQLQAGTSAARFTVEVARKRLALATPSGKPVSARTNLAVGDHELLLRVRPDSACVVLDGARQLRVPTSPPTGRVRAAAVPGEGIVPVGAPRVQRLGEIQFGDDFTRGVDAAPLWQTLAGHFALSASRTPGSSQGAFEFWGVAPGGGRGLAVAKGSQWFWDDCEIGVSGKGSADSAWGLVYDFADPENWRAVVVDPRAGSVRAIARENGRERVVHSENLPVRAGQWYRATVAMYDGHVAAFLNGHRLVSDEDARLTGGRIGLLVETAKGGEQGASFDDLTVQSLASLPSDWVPTQPLGPSETSWADFSQKDFSADPFMTQWAHPRSFWDRQADGLVWFRSRFFHDARFHWRREKGQRTIWPLQAALFADPDQPKSGYRLKVETARVSLMRSGKEVASAARATASVEELSFSVSAGEVQVAIDGSQALAWRDSAPIESGWAGASLGPMHGLQVERPEWRDSARVESTHRIDYGFDLAPVAWESPDATWQATHRWACVPKWSFFGGRGEAAGNGLEHANATLWNLRRFQGDVDIELFLAPMEGTPQRVHFASPANINVVFAAADGNYDSGYLLNFGLYDTPTRLFRAGKEVANWDGRVLPGLRRQPMPFYHRVTRVWQQIRIQRRGSRLLIDVAKHDGDARYLGLERVFDVQDDAPLTGDRLGVWSYGPNGLAVARATVSFAASPGMVPMTPVAAPAPAKGAPKNVRTAVNPVSGGSNPIWLQDLPADLARTGLLECPVRISAGQRTSLFVHLRGQVAELVLTGPDAHRDSTVPLGRGLPESYSPGTWQTVRVDLGTALRSQFPTGPLVPTAIALDSPCTSSAEVAGLGTNHAGSFVQIGTPTWRVHTPEAKLARTLALRVRGIEPLAPTWSTLGGSDGAVVYHETDDSIRLFNRRVGGPAGAVMDWGPFAVDAFPRLVFDYRLPADVESNLLVDAGGQRFEIRATGTDNTWPVIGAIPDFRADGQWHHAEVDLQALLAPRFPAEPATVERLMWADTKRMSTPRLAYWFRNVALVPVVDAAHGLDVTGVGAGIRALSHVLDTGSSTVPPPKATVEGTTLHIGNLDKATFLHVRPEYADGKWGSTLHLPLTTGTVADEAPAPGPQGAGALLSPWITYLPSDRLCYNDFESAAEGDGLERVLGQFRIRRGAWVDLVREPSAGTAPAHCVQFTNLAPSSFFSGYFRVAPWNLERWPRIAFDYKFEQPGCNLNLSLLVHEAMTIVEWTGPNRPGNYFHDAVVGHLPEARQDGAWHHVEFDLRDMVRRTRFPNAATRGRILASELSCWATNRHGGGYVNPNAARVRIDNFTIFSPRGVAPEFRWMVPGPGPAPTGYATVLDQKPDTVPGEKVNTTAPVRRYQDVAPGRYWFHVRARYADGRWGPAGHRQIEVRP
jgi:hypothetical protein